MLHRCCILAFFALATGLVGCSDDETRAATKPDNTEPDASIDAEEPDTGTDEAKPNTDAPASDTAHPDVGQPDSSWDSDPGVDTSTPCPDDVTCVDTFPFGEDKDTSSSSLSSMNGYSCSVDTNEGGAEIVYRVQVPEAGFLSAAVREVGDADVDVHILRERDASTCLDRGNYHARADVEAGTYWVVIDTYVSDNVPQAGAFHVDIGFVVPSKGPCDMQTGTMPRVNDNGDHLAMPATGPMVVEAHLVTQEEPSPYPSTETDELLDHYALSQQATGFVMHRSQPWAPMEGGSFYGCGIGSPANFPVLHEAWYVNMYWTSAARPDPGTRMILRKPGTNRAVVVAAGYETGPGDLSNIGGTPEEPHFYLGTAHEDDLTLGLAVDNALPLGPRTCE